MDNFKKDFQKAVKAFRDTLPDYMGLRWTGTDWAKEKPCRPEYPKAIMTASQIRKGTATINCSYGTGAKELAEKMMNFPQFKEWCEEWGIKKVYIETVPNPYGEVMQIQVRIIFPTEKEIKDLNAEIAAAEMQKFIDAGYLD